MNVLEKKKQLKTFNLENNKLNENVEVEGPIYNEKLWDVEKTWKLKDC